MAPLYSEDGVEQLTPHFILDRLTRIRHALQRFKANRATGDTEPASIWRCAERFPLQGVLRHRRAKQEMGANRTVESP
eukprot:scaffold1355_cov268-Pinguiococcus_pyrenoidosus.AAC.66